MNFLEKDLEQIIFETPPDQLIKRGLNICKDTKFLRQFKVPGYGIIDLVGYKEIGNDPWEFGDNLTVLELKQKTININSLLQISRYITSLNRCIDRIEDEIPPCKTQGILIGSEVDLKGDFIYLAAIAEMDVSIYTYDYKFDGISFTKINPVEYYASDEDLGCVAIEIRNRILNKAVDLTKIVDLPF